jgi:hypothetical protein
MHGPGHTCIADRLDRPPPSAAGEVGDPGSSGMVAYASVTSASCSTHGGHVNDGSQRYGGPAPQIGTCTLTDMRAACQTKSCAGRHVTMRDVARRDDAASEVRAGVRAGA